MAGDDGAFRVLPTGMNWLAAIVQGFMSALFGWGQKQAEKPATIKPAETPPAKLKEFQDRIEQMKREKNK